MNLYQEPESEHGMRSNKHKKESFSDKKIKRRESDAKCRANISAGFELLRKQVLPTEAQDKVSKEMVLNQSFTRIKYLEGVIVALHQTKEIKNGRKELLQDVSPLQHLRDIHHQFIAAQQRKGRGRGGVRQEDVCSAPRDIQSGIRRMSKRRRSKRKYSKTTPLFASQKHPKPRSPIIHLPPALHTPSRPQKRIKLASTDPSQDQVVPYSPILGPMTYHRYSHKKGAESVKREAESGSKARSMQTVPENLQIKSDDEGKHEAKFEDHSYSLKKLEDHEDAPPSPMIDVCVTPSKLGFISGPSLLSTPMKTYQIIGSSITPVKMDFSIDDSEDMEGPSLGTIPRLDLVCDEETASWPEDESSTSSSSVTDNALSCPWFSTPTRPTSLLVGDQPPSLLPKQRTNKACTPKGKAETRESSENRRKRLFAETTGGEVRQENAAPASCESVTGTPRKKYRKRATAARVRPWDSTTGRVRSPVQPYSGVFKSKQQIKMADPAKSKTTASPDFTLTGYLRRKLPVATSDPVSRPVRSTRRECFLDRQDLNLVCISDKFSEESDGEVIDLLGSDSPQGISKCTNDPVPSLCLSLHHSDPTTPSPTCLRDVHLPPPTGTISPPTFTQCSLVPGCDTSPELFRNSQTMWVRDAKGDQYQAREVGSLLDDEYQQDEDGFYDYHHQPERCGPEEDEGSLDDGLFGADLGDVRHLDPALRPPTSSLESAECIVHLQLDERDEHDDINITSDAENEDHHAILHSNLAGPVHTSSGNDVVITPALATFATSALHVKHATKRSYRHGQRKKRSVRLNLPEVSPAVDEEEDLNIWKFTQAALNDKDVLSLLPPDSSYSFLSNSY